ncbi:hypothetical protein ABE438_17590 [Bosea sp. TWI1241]|uniref:hypothetical protein n=1 Tax=Bosea sp. TWI1241 TaxID=3148904 RepID=UPI00320A5592
MAPPVPFTRPPYRLTTGNLVRLLGDESRTTVAGIHKIGRDEKTALQNGAFIRRACNSFADMHGVIADAVPILEAVLEDREADRGEDEILRDLLDRARAALATAEGRGHG